MEQNQLVSGNSYSALWVKAQDFSISGMQCIDKEELSILVSAPTKDVKHNNVVMIGGSGSPAC